MSNRDWLILAALAALAFCLVTASLALGRRSQRSRRLRDRFGPEYTRAVELSPTRRAGEMALAKREERHNDLDLRVLPEGARERYGRRWRDVQARFVDDPGGALHDADRLVEQVMADRGYPVEDFEHRVEVVSVDHGDLVASLRSAHDIYVRHLGGGATREELRHALVDYRSLFEELVGERAAA